MDFFFLDKGQRNNQIDLNWWQYLELIINWSGLSPYHPLGTKSWTQFWKPSASVKSLQNSFKHGYFPNSWKAKGNAARTWKMLWLLGSCHKKITIQENLETLGRSFTCSVWRQTELTPLMRSNVHAFPAPSWRHLAMQVKKIITTVHFLCRVSFISCPGGQWTDSTLWQRNGLGLAMVNFSLLLVFSIGTANVQRLAVSVGSCF